MSIYIYMYIYIYRDFRGGKGYRVYRVDLGFTARGLEVFIVIGLRSVLPLGVSFMACII